MTGTLKNHAAQIITVLLMTLVILLNCCPRGFSQTETSTEREARLTALLLAPSIPNAQAWVMNLLKLHWWSLGIINALSVSDFMQSPGNS